jgi:two-component system, OmpR family, response regulator
VAARILLVDDDKNRSDAVREILKPNGYLVVEASDRDNALFLLASEKFDLVLLDITLPDKSGFRVLEFLEKNHIASKVMVITGTIGIANVTRNATPGAQEHITKPYAPADLLRSIEHVLSERSRANLRLQIVKAGDFIKSTPTGDLDMKVSKQGFAQIDAAGNELRVYTVLIDLRDVKSKLSIANIYDLASELGEYGDTFRRKTAVLVRANEDLVQATFFENAAQNRGFEVKTFTVFEDAIIWLSGITQLTEDQSDGHTPALR